MPELSLWAGMALRNKNFRPLPIIIKSMVVLSKKTLELPPEIQEDKEDSVPSAELQAKQAALVGPGGDPEEEKEEELEEEPQDEEPQEEHEPAESGLGFGHASSASEVPGEGGSQGQPS